MSCFGVDKVKLLSKPDIWVYIYIFFKCLKRVITIENSPTISEEIYFIIGRLL